MQLSHSWVWILAAAAFAQGQAPYPMPNPDLYSLDDRYARVIADELMPVLYKEYNIAKDPAQHGIGGASSGAIAAFTVAWQRTDQFHKVISIVGSFTTATPANN